MEEESVETRRQSEAEEVMSEVHLGCPPGFSGFTFSIPPRLIEPSSSNDVSQVEDAATSISTQQILSFDEDGDLIVPRGKTDCPELSNQSYSVAIKHSITSTLPSVVCRCGEQNFVSLTVLGMRTSKVLFSSAGKPLCEYRFNHTTNRLPNCIPLTLKE